MLANKKLFLFVLLFGITVISNAQDKKFGVIGGLNFATIGGDAEGVEARVSYHTGIFYSSKIRESVLIQPELVYSSQGAKIEGIDVFFRYNYINVPIMIKYFVNDYFYLQGGPQLGVLISADVKAEDETEDVKNLLSPTDSGVGFGAGVEVENFIFSLRYNLGLSNTSDDSGNDTFPNRVLQVSVALPF